MTIGFATRIACSLALTAGVAVPVQAHHSHGNYMMSDFTFLEGKVTELHLVNPHSWIYLEVKDAKGETTVWALEATKWHQPRYGARRRSDQGPLPSPEGRLQRVSPRLCHTAPWRCGTRHRRREAVGLI
jgi:hypothetical protein